MSIEDNDVAPISVKSVNGPPVFTEGDSTVRTVAEQATRGTPAGLPVTAVDPDGDPLTYYMSGTDASHFSLDSRTGQLHVWERLDLETTPTYLLNLSVSDGRGGTDSIVVAINLSDIQEVPIKDPPTQASGLVTGETTFYLETPNGTGAVGLPEGVSELPFFVLVESDAAGCGGGPPAGTARAYMTVQLYDSWGNIMRDADMEGMVANLRFDAQLLGGVEATYSAHENGEIQVYAYFEREDDWRPYAFTLNVDELGVVTLIVGNVRAPACLVAVSDHPTPVHASSLAEPALESEAGQHTGWGANQGRLTRSTGRESTELSIPVVDVGGSGGSAGDAGAAEPLVVQSSMGGESPWWPKLVLVLGSVLLLGAVAWQLSQFVKAKRGLNKSFTGPRYSIWRDIFRA